MQAELIIGHMQEYPFRVIARGFKSLLAERARVKPLSVHVNGMSVGLVRALLRVKGHRVCHVSNFGLKTAGKCVLAS